MNGERKKMTEGSMKGSGIDSTEISLDVECEECNHEWEQDFVTDDWGNIDTDVECPSCNNKFSFSRSEDEIGGEDPESDVSFY